MSAAPWSVKGIDPKAREVAKDLARRSGLTLGEWLNSMIMEDGDEDEDVVPLPRRSNVEPVYDRRGRSRRMDDAYATDQVWLRLSSSVDALATRLETAEQRSAAAIQGIDQALQGMVRRLDGHDQAGKTYGRRIEDIAEELKEGHRRLRHFENDTGPRTADAIGKVEGSINGVASRLYDIEERQRSGVNELRQRMDALEKASAGPGSDALAQVGRRLDEAQARTSDALRDLERSFAGLDQRLRAAEGRVEPEGAREAARFEKLAETLTRQVEANRAELMLRLNTAETDNRIDRIERAVQSMSEQVRLAEDGSAKAVEAMGREILRIAQNLNTRMSAIERAGPGGDGMQEALQALTRRVEADRTRFEQKIEHRLATSDDRHVAALERLGGEITRISDRLSERIALSEKRSSEALDDIGRRLTDTSSRADARHDRVSSDLADRVRQSEERTAALLSEARDTLQRRAEPARVVAEAAWPEPATSAEPDWRAAAFPGADFGASPYGDDPIFVEQQAWSADLAPPEPDPEPEAKPAFAEAAVDAASPDEREDETAALQSQALAQDEAPVTPVFARSDAGPFGQGFGGADVADALAATAPAPLDDSPDDFEAETEFVDPRALRAAAAQGRASSTRQALEAARAAMGEAEPAAAAPRKGFSLTRGGKSRLQERLDRQAKGGGTVAKALGASAVAVVLTGGAVLASGELTGTGVRLSDLGIGSPTAQPVAALAMGGDAPVSTALEADRSADLFARAQALIEAGDATGVQVLTDAAQAGSAPAQLQLAGLYQNGGDGVAADPSRAREWARRAATAGDARGMHAYGMYLFDGVGGSQDQAGALKWLERAAAKGLVDSQFNVAKLYETGDTGIAADPEQAFKWYLIAARAGDGDAQAAVERLRAELPATERGRARAAADRFQVAPLA